MLPLWTPLPALAAETPFQECERKAAERPVGGAAAYCFFQVAAGAELQEEAARRLSVHLEREPDNPWLLFHLGRVLHGLDAEAATKHYRRAAPGFASAGEHRYEAYARFNASRLLRGRGRLEEAAEALRHAERAAERAGDPNLRHQVMIDRAVLMQLGQEDLETARQLLLQVRDEAPSDWHYRAALLLELGNVHLLLGGFAQARRYFRDSLDMARQRQNAYQQTLARVNLANSAFAERFFLGEDLGVVEPLVREALQDALEAGDRETESRARYMLGKLLSGAEAESHLRRCVQLSEPDHVGRLAECRLALAAQLAGRDPTRARQLLADSRDALQQLPQPQSRLLSVLERLAVVWRLEPPEQALADSLEVLEQLERLRGLQRLGTGRARRFSLWTYPYYWISGRLLQDAAESGDGLGDAFRLIERMRARLLLDVLQESGLLQPGPALPMASLERVANQLRPDEALLSFQVADLQNGYGDFGGGAWLTAVSSSSARVYPLPDRRRLERQVPLLAGLVQRRDGSHEEAARGMFEALLRRALDDLPAGVRHLILVPDAALHQLPFPALLDGRSGEPLASRYRLSVVPSATLWLTWRERPPVPAARKAIVFADPETDAEGLGRLPHARREAAAARSLLGPAAVVRRQGEEAGEGFVRQAAPSRFRMLVFAAHTVIDPGWPERSAVLLSSDSAEDGRLEPAEIGALDLRGKVVVLSSCRAASGRVLRGEGVMSVARAFFEAGASAVVAGLWPLEDREAAALFEPFYARLAEGADLASALAWSQREALRSGMPEAAWAGLLVVGDATRTPFPVAPPSGWPWLAALPAALLLVLLSRFRQEEAPKSLRNP